MKNLLTLIFCLAFLGQGALLAQTKNWTLLVYMVGSDIVEDGITDLGEMKAAGNTDSINIVAMLGGSTLAGWETPTTSIFVNGNEIAQDFVPSVPHMANSTNITEFINWGVSNYPAEKYMLLFYNHGMDIRGFGWDNTVDKSSSVGDIQTGIANSDFIKNDNKFEVLGFDACLMASFEVQSALRNFAKYYVASEETEPYHAWNWTPIITAMNTQADLNGAELGKIIVDEYMQQSKDEKTEHVTLSVTDLSKINNLETALEQLVLSLDDDLYVSNFMKARANSEEYHKVISTPELSDDMVDIGDLVKHLKALEPTIEDKVDSVLARIDEAVIYERSDSTRPRATGISMYVPFNVLVDTAEGNAILDIRYNPIEFSDTIKNFIANTYYPFAVEDNEPIDGSIDPDWGLTGSSSDDRGENGTYSAIRLNNQNGDLHQIQVILLEEIIGVPDEFLILGSTYPDTSVTNADGSTTFAYEWDEEWLGLNGHPAYIADIQDFLTEDDDGMLEYHFTRIHTPAILNPNTADEKNIMISFVFDEDFNYELEGILREPYGNEVIIPSKERIDLAPGDQVQLLYEVFDAVTNEATFVANDNAIIDIQTGNDDLILDHSKLEPGKYHIGFVLMDHSHNDTIIYDPKVREIISVNTHETIEETISAELVPNPVSDIAKLKFNKMTDANIELYNQIGVLVERKKIENERSIDFNLRAYPNGTYLMKITTDKGILTEKLIKQ
jgi:hypothetical protein